MAIKTKVVITEKGSAKSLQQFFGGSKQASVTIGVFGEAGEAPVEGEAGLTLAELAAIHEFGLGNNPERSFIRSYFDANQDRIKAMLLKLAEIRLAKAIKTGQPITVADKRQMLEQIGLKIVGEIQARIGAGEIQPPLTEQTIKRKGSSIPLIDTNQLRAGITYKVEVG